MRQARAHIEVEGGVPAGGGDLRRLTFDTRRPVAIHGREAHGGLGNHGPRDKNPSHTPINEERGSNIFREVRGGYKTNNKKRSSVARGGDKEPHPKRGG